jgi:hypothetical protein
MSVYGIIGKPKEGKTLFMRALMLYSNYDEYYSNISISGLKYKRITTVNDILGMKKDNKTKGIYIDEMRQMGSDSWSYDKLGEIIANFCLQHRKFHADLTFTEQFITSLQTRQRGIINGVYKPFDIFRNMDGKPTAIRVMPMDYDIYGELYPRIENSFWFPLFKKINNKVVYACDLYDTYEFVEPMEKLNITTSVNMIEKYKDFNLNKEDKTGRIVPDSVKFRDLKSILTLDEKLPLNLANQICGKISYTQRLAGC